MADEKETTEEAPDRGDEVDLLDDEFDEVTDDELNDSDADAGVQQGQEGREEEVEKDKEPVMIPKGRFDEKTRQLQEIKDENAWLKAQLEKVVSPKETKEATPSPEATAKDITKELSAKRREFMTAIADGDIDTAETLNDEILALQSQADEIRVQRYLEKVLTDREVQKDLKDAQGVADQILANHPELNDDKELYEEFIFARDFARHKGKNMSAALQDAEKRIFGKRTRAGDLTKEEPKEDLAQRTKDARKREAVDRNLKAENAQPPLNDKGAGERMTSGKRRVRDMTDEEFDKLSATEKKALRGD